MPKTKVEATWLVRESASATFEMDAEPDDIGWHEVVAEIRAAGSPFDDIDEESVEWEIVDDD